MKPSNRQTLIDGLTTLGIEVDAARIERLVSYHDLLMEWNERLNLTGAKDEAQSVVKNLLNALGPWRQIHPTKSTCDVGTGGGLPGLPLAIALEMPQMALIESKAKKCRFLEEACAKFAPGVKVMQMDINAVQERFKQIIVCAFGTLDKIARACEPRLAAGGRILAYKGRRETIDEELTACKSSHQKWELIPFAVPGLEDGAQRHLCVYRSRT